MLETQEVKMEIIRNRVLRTKTCLPDSSYKVNCEKVITKDLLILNVFDKNDLLKGNRSQEYLMVKLKERSF